MLIVRAMKEPRRSAMNPGVVQQRDWVEVIDESADRDVLPRSAVCLPGYLFFCYGIESVAISDRACDEILAKIERVESGAVEFEFQNIEDYVLGFGIDGASLLLDHGHSEPELGGDVSLAQLKSTVQVLRKYLSDPFREMVEAPFPEAQLAAQVRVRRMLLGDSIDSSVS